MSVLFTWVLALHQALQVAPVTAPGNGAVFLNGVEAVERALSESKFDEAKSLLMELPKREVHYRWDDSGAPENKRLIFRAAAQSAISKWARQLGSKVTFTEDANHPDITFSFEKVLAQAPGEDYPYGSAWFFHAAVPGPRLEVVIGLRRGSPLAPVDDVNIKNEVGRAIGGYFGLQETTYSISIMHRVELSAVAELQVTPTDSITVLQNLDLVGKLESACSTKTAVTHGVPSLFVDPITFDVGDLDEGAIGSGSVQISNRGTAPLAFRVNPLCSCVASTRGATINPGESRLIQFSFNSAGYAGKVDQPVYLSTNDPDQPFETLTLASHVRAMYRIYDPGPTVRIAKDNGVEAVIYLIPSPKRQFHLLSVYLQGIDGKVAIAPWHGPLADPEMNEPALERVGYKVHAYLNRPEMNGRLSASLEFTTDDKLVPKFYYTFDVQAGIVAIPVEAYFGEVLPEPTERDITISRPGKPFKIVSVTCTHPNFHITLERDGKTGDYHMKVVYDGNAPAGPQNGIVKLKTDDPSQPYVLVNVRAVVP